MKDKKHIGRMPARRSVASRTARDDAPEAPALEEPLKKDTHKRLTVNVDRAVVRRAQAAVFFDPPVVGQFRLTMSGLVERALVAEIKRIEKQRGEKFPAAAVKLAGGRPLKLS